MYDNSELVYNFGCLKTNYKKGFIRFKLHNDDNLDELINNIMHMTLHCATIGSKPYAINLGLNIILMKEYGQEIQLLNVDELLEKYGQETLDSTIRQNTDDGYIINHKYIFNKTAKYYLDIPLLENFYTCGDNNGSGFYNLSYKFNTFEHTILTENFNVHSMFIGFEEITVTNETLVSDSSRLNCLNSKQFNNFNDPGCDPKSIIVTFGGCDIHFTDDLIPAVDLIPKYIKYVFVSVNKLTQPTSNITKISLYYNCEKINIPLENIKEYNFDDKIVYGFCTDIMSSLNQVNISDETYFSSIMIDMIYIQFDEVICGEILCVQDIKDIKKSFSLQFNRPAIPHSYAAGMFSN